MHLLARLLCLRLCAAMYPFFMSAVVYQVILCGCGPCIFKFQTMLFPPEEEEPPAWGGTWLAHLGGTTTIHSAPSDISLPMEI